MKLAPSLLAADLSDLAGAVRKCEESATDFIHWDVMDGHFVPNLTFGAPVIKCARPLTGIPFDVHLMVENPGAYTMELAQAGVQFVSFHIEAEAHAHRLIQQIGSTGMKAGVAINPQTPPSAIEYLLPSLDYVLVMAVNPGFAGQKFIEPCLKKISILRDIRREYGLDYQIEVDGGVSEDNLERIALAGADIVVAGKAFFTADDMKAFTIKVRASSSSRMI